MTPLRILATPELHEPTLIVAFAGWSDAAAQYLTERWRAVRLAEIDAEEFFDFTQLRPTVRYEGEVRRIDWPENAFHYHETPKRHLIIFKGIEPHLRWKTYTEAMLEVIDRFQVKLVVGLNAVGNGSQLIANSTRNTLRLTSSNEEGWEWPGRGLPGTRAR